MKKETKKITFVISKKLEEKFRLTAFKIYGYKKGSLSKAIEKAIENFIKEYENEGD